MYPIKIVLQDVKIAFVCGKAHINRRYSNVSRTVVLDVYPNYWMLILLLRVEFWAGTISLTFTILEHLCHFLKVLLFCRVLKSL